MSKTHFLHNTKGFTLIEISLYLALFSIVIFGAITSALTIIDGSQENTTKAFIAAEAQFLISKLDFYTNGLESVQVPAVNSQCAGPSCSLAVITHKSVNQSVKFLFGTSTVELFIDARSRGVLHSNRVMVSSFSVAHTEIQGKVATLDVLFTMSATTTRGILVSQDFEISYTLQNDVW